MDGVRGRDRHVSLNITFLQFLIDFFVTYLHQPTTTTFLVIIFLSFFSSFFLSFFFSFSSLLLFLVLFQITFFYKQRTFFKHFFSHIFLKHRPQITNTQQYTLTTVIHTFLLNFSLNFSLNFFLDLAQDILFTGSFPFSTAWLCDGFWVVWEGDRVEGFEGKRC